MTSSSRILAVCLVSLATAVGACSVSATSDNAVGGVGDINPGTSADAGTFGTPTGGGGDAAAPATTKLGSALCNATTSTTCVPDGQDDTTSKCDVSYGGAGVGGADDGDGGVGLPLDAGAVAPSSFACHVTLPDAGVAEPVCLPAGQGKNGASCKASTDCASGFECVGSSATNTTGICRQYCCVNACDDNSFCDVQSEKANQAVKVPVCEPVQHCGLLASPSDCSGDETCGIVDDDDGTTSCVQIGPAKAGESCEDTHCGRNLTCLGPEGSRKCVALCDKSKPICTAPQQCAGTAPLIHDMNVGVCQEL